jgi:shikimate kinase
MKNIYLIGFMGAGKSSTGKRLAEILPCEFVDLDEEIEAAEKKRVREIFVERGEPAFRKAERDALLRVSSHPGRVVALGGGAFCDPRNRDTTKNSGTTVWLDAPVDLIISRCAGDDSRPLFTNRAEVEALLKKRLPDYALADIRIDVTGMTVDEVAAEILRLVVSGQRPAVRKD